MTHSGNILKGSGLSIHLEFSFLPFSTADEILKHPGLQAGRDEKLHVRRSEVILESPLVFNSVGTF